MFNNLLGIHESALLLREKRAELLATNLANADTPGYKARDIDFQAALKNASQSTSSAPVGITNNSHMPIPNAGQSAQVAYRIPLQPSLDGNTVDTQIETAEFVQNSVNYQASLRFINGKLSGLMSAIKGE